MNYSIQREAVLKELQINNNHFTADELYGILRKKVPQISLATIYRNLECLAKHGKIRRVSSFAAQKRFEGNTDFHFHIRCSQCGKLTDLPSEVCIALDIILLGKAAELDCKTYYLEFLAECDECLEKSEKTKIKEKVSPFSLI